MAFTSVPANITQAINFLTLPLILTQTSDLVMSVQSVLRTTLPAALAPRGGKGTLSFSPDSLPPRPVLAASIACNFPWDDWMTLLGHRDFDLTIEPHTVLVTYFDLSRPYTITIWSEPTPNPVTRPLLAKLRSNESQVPISKLSQRSQRHIAVKATLDSAIARTKTRTLAQQLLEENHKQEADEIFDMISKTSILSPTPTRQDFPTIRLPSLTTGTAIRSTLSSPEVVSPADSSRPSSRSSTYSSCFSDDESITSASSAASFNFSPSLLKKPQQALDKRSPAFVPRLIATQVASQEKEESANVIVDTNKKDKTKYLYQGGCTTVVTGGVMLGSGTTAACKADPPKHRVPFGGRNKAPVPFSPADKNVTAFAQSWRRAATRV